MINLTLIFLTLTIFFFFKLHLDFQLVTVILESLFFFTEWNSTSLGTGFFIVKLTISWFIIVWLRLNLFRYRFDQVASYTWHELVIVAVFFLVTVLILQYIF